MDEIDRIVLLDQVRVVCEILQGFKILHKVCINGYCYNGPNVYKDWQKEKFEATGFKPWQLSVRMKIKKSDESKFQKLLESLDCVTSSNGKFEILRRSSIGTSVDQNPKNSCKNCQKRRKTRCQKCPGCLSTKCKLCVNCLEPQRKQACLQRVCRSPVFPNCPACR